MKQNTDKKKAKLFADDPLLMQYHEAIEGRHDYYQQRLARLLGGRRRKLLSFANGHLYYGLHRLCDRSWVFREWLPNAERAVQDSHTMQFSAQVWYPEAPYHSR